MRRFLLFTMGFLLPVAVLAAGENVTRREGFLAIWKSMQREATEVREKPYADVPTGSEGSLEITYAKARGLLEDEEERFRPDDPLTIEDALLWLFRTRNVHDIEDMEREDLPSLLERYPIANAGSDLRVPVSQADLLRLMRLLDTKLREEEHEISLYSEKFHGDGTAFGETFNMYAFTAAHRTFPHNTLVRVTNVENDQSVVVRVNDRGPFVEGRDMDLSLAAFTSIADRSKGVIMARFERMGDVNLVDLCGRKNPRYQKRITRDVMFDHGVPHRFPLGESLVLSSTKAFVVSSVRYPDGNSRRFLDWVLPGEKFSFTPAVEGEYVFFFRTVEGRGREMRMKVAACGN